MTATDTSVAPHSHGPGSVSGSPAERFVSTNPADFAIPRGREEEWRFSPVTLLRPYFEPFASEDTETVSVTGPSGASWSTVGRDHPLFGQAAQPSDRTSALAFANASQALLIEIPAEAVLHEPVTVLVDGRPGSNYGHVIVEAGAYSKATVVFRHHGDTVDLANVEFLVRDGADLTVVRPGVGPGGRAPVRAHRAARP